MIWRNASREQSSINKSRTWHIRAYIWNHLFIGRSGATERLVGLLIIPIRSIWSGHEKSHVPGVGWRFRSVASPQLSSFQPLTPLKYSTEMATLTVPCERAAGMMLRVRCLNREAVYSDPADAEEALELPRENRYMVADDRGKWYGRMENGGI